MRMLAAALAVLFGALFGLCLQNRLRRQERVLRQICLLLRQMRTKTACLHTPFPELVRAFCDAQAFSDLTFLPDCAVQCDAGVAFPEAWNEAVRRFRRSGALSAGAGRELSELAFSACGADAESVDGVLSMYEQTMCRYAREAREHSRTGGQLCVRVCGAVGLLFGILII